MKKTLLTIMLLVATAGAFSQDNIIKTNGDEENLINLKKNRIAGSLGGSFAINDFGSSEETNSKAGFAGSGAYLNLVYTHKFNPNIGLGVKWYGNSNEMNSDPFIKSLNSKTGVKWTAETSSWSSGGLLAGIVAFVPADKVTFEFSALGGFMTLNSPEMTYTLSSNKNFWMKQNSITASSFGYNLGLGFDYLFSKHWSLLVNLDYLTSTFKFGDLVIKTSTNEAMVTAAGSQTFDAINITGGIGYNF